MTARTIQDSTRLSEPVELRNMQGDVYVTLQQKLHYIEAKWYGHISADEIVCAALAYLDLLRLSGCPRLMNDKTEVTGDWQDVNDWIQFEWLPKATEAGLRCFAHVYSQNMFSRLSARDLCMRVSPLLQMQNFDDREEAEIWIMQCNTSYTPPGRAASA